MINELESDAAARLPLLLRQIANALDKVPPREFSVEINNDYVEFPGTESRMPEHGIKGAAYPVDRISTLRTPIIVPQIPLSADSVEKSSAKFWRRTPCHLYHLSRATVRRLRALREV